MCRVLHLLDEDMATVHGAGHGDVVHAEGLGGEGQGVAAVGVGDEDGGGLVASGGKGHRLLKARRRTYL